MGERSFKLTKKAWIGVILIFASVAMGADYDPDFKPVPLYDRSRPSDYEEARRRKEERAVLRVHGMRRRPLACSFRKAYQYLPYDRYNIILTCEGEMSLYR